MPDLKNVIVFLDQDILRPKPFTDGQQPIHETESIGGVGKKHYSSGKLEFALRHGLSPHIVSLLPAAPTFHDWLNNTLGEANFSPSIHVHFTRGLLDGVADLLTNKDPKNGGPEKMLEKVMQPWRELFAVHGVAWEQNLDSPVKAKAWLVRRGAKDGARFGGFAEN